MMETQSSPEQQYYENEALWARDFELDLQERARLDAAIAIIPPEVRSVLDVGCGNGAFVHRAATRFERVCGVDRSAAALNFVRTEKRLANIDELPFGRGEFDLVACMEVIEHLPQPAFTAALRELLRVSGKWLLITVPCREDRRLSLVRCPQCLCEFNRNYHLRSFDEAAMARLFNSDGQQGANLRQLRTVGSIPHRVGVLAARRLAAPFRTPVLPRGVLCPQCGAGNRQSEAASQAGDEHTARGLRAMRRLWPAITRPRWWLALYRASPQRPLPS